MNMLRDSFLAPKPEDNTQAPKLIIRQMEGADITEIMGLKPFEHSGPNFNAAKAYYTDHIRNSLVAIEPRSKEHPQGLMVGYALLKKHKEYGDALGLSEIMIHPSCEKASDYYLGQLIEKSARVCMANGQDSMNVLVCNNDATTKEICSHYKAKPSFSKMIGDQKVEIFTIEDLLAKFGLKTELTSSEPRPS
jgi:hypothetical protein